MRPEAAHAPGVCRLAGCPLAGPLLAKAHGRGLRARAAKITTAAGPTARKTTIAAAPEPGSSAHCSTAAGRRWGNRWAASEGRPAGPPRTRPTTGHPGSHRHTATDSRGAGVVLAGAVGRRDAGAAPEAGRSTGPDRRTGRTAVAARG